MTSQSGGNRFSGNQYGGNQGSVGGQSSYSQGSGVYGSQSSGGLSSQGSGQYGQNGGYATQSYNKTWTSTGQGLTAEEQEQIRRNIQNAAGGQGQSGYGQGGYIQGGSQGGLGQGGEIIRMKNRTIVYDANHNIISQTETSTEYGSLGHEGEDGSSFNV